MRRFFHVSISLMVIACSSVILRRSGQGLNSAVGLIVVFTTLGAIGMQWAFHRSFANLHIVQVSEAKSPTGKAALEGEEG